MTAIYAAGSANVTRRRPMAACSAIIYARRIENGLTLPHADRDFGPFAVHLGIVAIHQAVSAGSMNVVILTRQMAL